MKPSCNPCQSPPPAPADAAAQAIAQGDSEAFENWSKLACGASGSEFGARYGTETFAAARTLLCQAKADFPSPQSFLDFMQAYSATAPGAALDAAFSCWARPAPWAQNAPEYCAKRFGERAAIPYLLTACKPELAGEWILAASAALGPETLGFAAWALLRSHCPDASLDEAKNAGGLFKAFAEGAKEYAYLARLPAPETALQSLLSGGADPRFCDPWGRSLLYLANASRLPDGSKIACAGALLSSGAVPEDLRLRLPLERLACPALQNLVASACEKNRLGDILPGRTCAPKSRL